MRLVHLADYGGPYAGSFVPMLRALAVEARGRGHETALCFSEDARERSWVPQLQDVAEVCFLTPGHGPSRAREVRRLLGASSQETVLHTHFGRFDVAAVLAAANRRRTVVFWHKHNLLLEDPRVRVRNSVRFALFGRRVAGALCVTPEIRDAMVARHFPAQRAHHLPNAIDLDRFPPITSSERAEARERLGLPVDARVVLHFAWDWLVKGGDLLLDACERLGELDPPPLIATVLGERAPQEVRQQVGAHPSLRALAPSADVNSYYAAADVFVSTSRVEGINYALLEALARGLPVVATVMAGQRAMLEEIPGARAVSHDAGEVARAIGELLAVGARQRAEQAAAARRSLERSFALAPWVARVLDFYARALGAKGSTA